MYLPAGVTILSDSHIILGRKLKDSEDVINEMHGCSIVYDR